MKGQTRGTGRRGRQHPARGTESRVDLHERLLGGLPGGLPDPPPLEAFDVGDEIGLVSGERMDDFYIETE